MNADSAACRQRLQGAHGRAGPSTAKLAAREARLLVLAAPADAPSVGGLSAGRRQLVVPRATLSQCGWRKGRHPHSGVRHATNHVASRCIGKPTQSADTSRLLERTR